MSQITAPQNKALNFSATTLTEDDDSSTHGDTTASRWSEVWNYVCPLGIKYKLRGRTFTDFIYMAVQSDATTVITAGQFRIGKRNADGSVQHIFMKRSLAAVENYPDEDQKKVKFGMDIDLAPGQELFIDILSATVVDMTYFSLELNLSRVSQAL